jgi:TatD DNase family protein
VWKRWDKYWDTGDRTFLIWDGGFQILFFENPLSLEGYMIFDTHAHYDDEQFNEDRVELLNSMEEQGVGTIVNVSATYNSCRKVIALAKEYPFVYAAVGIHPDEVGSLNEETFAQMKELFKEEKVVAVGEIGLDYYWDNEPREVQKNWFIRQLELARELDLPVLIHSREAAADTMEIMKEHAKGLSGVIHCYSYSKEMAQEYIKMGFYIGVGGVVTFKNAKKLKEVVENIPLTSIVLETDCPYMAPEPNRGKRNNSAYIRYVAEKIAELKGITYEEVVEQTEKNAREMYRL